MRTSFHHQPEAQHPKSSAIHKNAGRLPHLLAQSGHYRLSSNVRFWGYVAVPMAALPDELNLYEATILPL